MGRLNFQIHHIFPIESFDDLRVAALLEGLRGEFGMPTVQAKGNLIALYTHPDQVNLVLAQSR